MDEGFMVTSARLATDVQPVVCDVCDALVESEKKDRHLYAEHGILA
ncbi:MAG: hypothetical protein OK455_02755 [Thaumarchaeota archaeon]|nr:hypothetical protein [Nitrososphaerota archaeon]